MYKCSSFLTGICPPFLTSLSLAKLGNKNLWSRQARWRRYHLFSWCVDRQLRAGLPHGARGTNGHLSEGLPWPFACSLSALLQTSVCLCVYQVWSLPFFSTACQFNGHLNHCLTVHLSVQIHITNNCLLLQWQIFHEWSPLKHNNTVWRTSDTAEVWIKVLLLKEIATKTPGSALFRQVTSQLHS